MSEQPSILVKNTFLDLDDNLRVPELQRWQSAPNPRIHDFGDSDEEEDAEEADAEEAGKEEAEVSDDPPPVLDMYRFQTFDQYEPANEWMWLSGDPNLIVGGPGSPPRGAFAGDNYMDPCPALGEVQPAAPEAQPDLKRLQTADGFEPVDQWIPPPLSGGQGRRMWPDGDASRNTGEPGSLGRGPFVGDHLMAPCAALGEVDPAATAPAPEVYAPPFGVMVGPPMPFLVNGLPPDYVAVPVGPVGRFTRWPPTAAPTLPAPALEAAAEAEGPPAAPAPTPVAGNAPGQPPLGEALASAAAASLTAGGSASSSMAHAADAPQVEDAVAAAPASPTGTGAQLNPAALMPAPQRAPVLLRSNSVSSSLERIRWTVDARKLRSTDREAVSPLFDLSFGRPINFKVLIRPKVVCNNRGGASFKKAKGKGSVELRCLDEVTASMNPVVTFRLSVGSSTDPARQEAPRGPVTHDFTRKAICGLPAGQEEWDFTKAIDEATQTFVVCLEVRIGAL